MIAPKIMKRKFANFLIDLPCQVKRLLSLGFDLSVSLFCTFGFLLIVTNVSEQLFNTQNLTIAALLAGLQIGALWTSGTYQTVARFLGLKSLAKSSLFLLSDNAFIFANFALYGVDLLPTCRTKVMSTNKNAFLEEAIDKKITHPLMI
jgi:hypothetical protein